MRPTRRFRSSVLRPLSILLVLASLATAGRGATVLVVDGTHGDDKAPGTPDRPFATIERARDAIRTLKAKGEIPAGGVVVEIAGGVYERTRAFELSERDGGGEGAPIVYRARGKEAVRLVGGRRLQGWKRVSNPAILGRLDATARKSVWQVDLRALGIEDLGEVAAGGRRLELFFQDRPMTVARWPDQGFLAITDVLGPTPVDIRGTKGCKEGIFAYEGDRPRRWVGEPDAWVHGYWFWDWSEQRHPIASIDPKRHSLRVEPPYHGYGYRKGQWFYAFNVLAELDQPGEWYLDRTSGILYFWPPAPLESSPTIVSIAPNLIALRGTSNVTFRGLTFESSRGTAIVAADVAKVRIVGCTIRNAGAGAVSLTGRDSGVIGCDVYGMAGDGISLQGGDRKSLTPGNLVADNNHIHHFGRWDRVYQPGISLAGVGLRASHNLIDHAPHMAIGFGGNDHVIEFNEIHDVCYESNDAGAMYAGRNWTMRGTIIRNNYLHHIDGFQGRGCVGVYLDDQFSGTLIQGNVFHKVTRAGMIGGGRDCTIENNIFVDCVPATHVDARGLGWADDGFPGLKASLLELPTTTPPWSVRYPQLVHILDEDPMAPKGNLIARNICVAGRWGDFEEKARPLVKFQDNLLDKDPHFVDPARADFRLQPNSPALALGFRPIPVEKIGLYPSDDRASWPVDHPRE